MPNWICPYWELDVSLSSDFEEQTWTYIKITNPTFQTAVLDLIVYEHLSDGSYTRREGGSWNLGANSWLLHNVTATVLDENYSRKNGWIELYSNQQVLPYASIRRTRRYLMPAGNESFTQRWIGYYQETVLPFEHRQYTGWVFLKAIFLDFYDYLRGPRSRIYAPGTKPIDQSKTNDVDPRWQKPSE